MTSIPTSSQQLQFSLAMPFEDKYPVTEGHTLFSLLRHTPSFLNLVLENRRRAFC
jgi:diadenosine tetraphosphate (Ap4A) HIT family hydrolase